MDRVGTANRNRFKALMTDAHDTFNQQPFIWKKQISGLDRYMEDNVTAIYEDRPLLGLFDYNYFRKWATVFTQPAGELDRQTTVVLINLKYLRDLGYLNANGRMDYDPALDRFVYDGIVYKATSDTRISQNKNNPQFFDILLEREDIKTGEIPFNANFP